MITRDNLKEYINYNPETGQMIWIKKKQGVKLGRDVGFINRGGNGYPYKKLNFENKIIALHRVIWFYMTGYLPDTKVQVYHIDKNSLNNKWDNLKLASRNEIGIKASISKNNKSGVTGVIWLKREKAWRSQIFINGELQYLGYYKDFFEAVCRRKSAESKLVFENYGK